MTPAEAAAKDRAKLKASARKTGRNPAWPYVPVIVHHDGSIRRQDTRQILGVAYATREEAVAAAETHLDDYEADLADKLSQPRFRALRAHHGVDA